MNGWGNVFLTITPDGTALPCHTAKMLPGLDFPNVREMNVKDIWFDSDGFNRFRGDGWMKEPCRTCPEKEKDLGGCRCQAYMLTGDAANADPVCDKSPLARHDRGSRRLRADSRCRAQDRQAADLPRPEGIAPVDRRADRRRTPAGLSAGSVTRPCGQPARKPHG